MDTKQEISLDTLYNLINLKVLSLLDDDKIKIDLVEHNQFQEAYFFRLGEDLARVNIWYNDKNFITSVKSVKKSQLGNLIKDKLHSLEGAPIHEYSTGNKFHFPYPFLYEFYLYISCLFNLNNINIERIDSIQWGQKYTVKRDKDYTIITFWYNKDQQFTRYSYASKILCAADFIEEIDQLLTEKNLFNGK